MKTNNRHQLSLPFCIHILLSLTLIKMLPAAFFYDENNFASDQSYYTIKKRREWMRKLFSPFQWTVNERKRQETVFELSFFSSSFSIDIYWHHALHPNTHIYTSGWNKIDCSLNFEITKVAALFIVSGILSMNWWKFENAEPSSKLLFEHMYVYVYEHALQMKNCLASCLTKMDKVDHSFRDRTYFHVVI